MKDKMNPKHKRTKDGFMKPKAKQPIKNVEGKAITRFDRVYRKLGNSLIPESKRIDIVLIHPDSKADDSSLSSKEKRKIQVRDKLREIFENTLRDEGFIVEESVLKDKVYKKIHCPFKRLCIEAETTNLEMPLKGVSEFIIVLPLTKVQESETLGLIFQRWLWWLFCQQIL